MQKMRLCISSNISMNTHESNCSAAELADELNNLIDQGIERPSSVGSFPRWVREIGHLHRSMIAEIIAKNPKALQYSIFYVDNELRSQLGLPGPLAEGDKRNLLWASRMDMKMTPGEHAIIFPSSKT